MAGFNNNWSIAGTNCAPDTILKNKIEAKMNVRLICVDTQNTFHQCGLFCLLGRDQKIETKLGCENIMSQNTIVQQIGLIERLRF